MRTTIIANGLIHSPQEVASQLLPDDYIIAADGGAQNCLLLGLWPAIVIGDLDSLPNALHDSLSAYGAQFIIYPRNKDQTDLELAMAHALENGATDIVLCGLLGGRLDQSLANLLLLSRDEWKEAHIKIIDGPDSGYILKNDDEITISGQPGDTVSLIPLTSKVFEVTTKGLRWSLDKDELQFGSTRGISNEMETSQAQVIIKGGKLLLVHRKNRSIVSF